jgi:hypothetical protein
MPRPRRMPAAQKKWGPALLPAPTAPSEGSAGVRNLVDRSLAAYLPALDPGSPAQASLPIRPLPLARSPTDLPDYVARRLAGLSVRPACLETLIRRSPLPAKPSDFPRPFLGRPLLRPASLTDGPKTARNRVALEENRLFRRLFPAGPGKNPKVLPTACRRRSDLWSPAAPSFRCRFLGEAGTAVPITHAPCASRSSRGSEKCGIKPVDNGDFGNNNWNQRESTLRLPIRSPCPTSSKCLNRPR